MDMPPALPARPQPGDHSDFHARYVHLVPEPDLLAAMEAQPPLTGAAFLPYLDSPDHTYAPGKWTVRQVLGHMLDTERVLGGRLLWVARQDPATQAPNSLPGFEQDDWMRRADFGAYTLPELLAEFGTVRAGHLSLLRHLPPDVWERRGRSSGHEFTVRGLAFVLLGHERAHLEVLEERYALGSGEQEMGSGCSS